MILMNDLSGRRFGRLFVRLPDWDAGEPNQWRVSCLCGVSVTVDGDRLLAGEIKSCGCLDRIFKPKA